MMRKPKDQKAWDARLPDWHYVPKQSDLIEAEAAAGRLTPDYIKRGKRIQKAGASKMLVDARQLFDRVMRKYGIDTARDVFRQVLALAPGEAKQKNTHNPESRSAPAGNLRRERCE